MSRLPSVLNLRARAALLLVVGLVLLSAAGGSGLRAAPAESEGEVAAREVALELAGAFSNDGYKIRDGHWSGKLQPKAAQVIAVNLYAGNQYYFSLGATDKAKKISVAVFDETGKPVAGEEFFQEPEKSRAAAGVSPVASGPYYISIQMLDGAAADFCLIYSYK